MRIWEWMTRIRRQKSDEGREEGEMRFHTNDKGEKEEQV